jgi:hypothetical protein
MRRHLAEEDQEEGAENNYLKQCTCKLYRPPVDMALTIEKTCLGKIKLLIEGQQLKTPKRQHSYYRTRVRPAV